ncbi:MAG: bifunctional ornithine acetyltransferase/N-acetylglutamate synthase, partial [Candidatus Omnitrophica bacterium]|nr:bifunctional ornithine acetyltransferase/N-acetylglutamate synthase [Candidatus Omnitrophota bacterium]
MKIYQGAILPKGFQANAVHSGIKKSKKLDVGLLFSESACRAAAVFTTNKFAAAPVVICRDLLKANNIFHGVIVNSGNANCFTGESGIKAARLMSSAAVKNLGLKTKGIFVASTGIIGKKLPVEKIIRAIPELKKGLSAGGIKKFSQGILTTDKFKKEITVKINIQGKQITVSSVAKGAGMISPHMATMLCFITSDINIEKACLKEALKSAVADSFNSISVDGCQSTNDTVFILANGLAGNKILNKVSREYP